LKIEFKFHFETSLQPKQKYDSYAVLPAGVLHFNCLILAKRVSELAFGHDAAENSSVLAHELSLTFAGGKSLKAGSEKKELRSQQ